MPVNASAATLAVLLTLTGGAVATSPQPGLASVSTTAQAGVLPPERLSQTGLYLNGDRHATDPGHLEFVPVYSLWSDGASKRRWLSIPPGTAIDASEIDHWEFPRGTRVWKQFSHDRPVETRLIERLEDGSWRYLAYVWTADGSDALLAPAEGIAGWKTPGAPGDTYDIPSRDECRACHEGTTVPLLGVSALQLSPHRDPQALGDEAAGARPALPDLVERGWLANLDQVWLERPPRIPSASPRQRAALGYLHANCGHCHNDEGPLAVLELVLNQRARQTGEAALGTLIAKPADQPLQGLTLRVVAGNPANSLMVMRMRSRDPLVQMPPLGTRSVDTAALALIEQWIQHDLGNTQESTR